MNYWAVGATFGRTEDMSKEFFEDGNWYDGYAENEDNRDDIYLRDVNIGDILLMKSSSTKGKNHSISFTKLKGIGKVLSKIDFHHFKMEWFDIKVLPRDFEGIWYAKTIEKMRDDKMLYFAKQILINEEPKNKLTPTKTLKKNSLVWRTKPKDGYTDNPGTTRTFKGVEIDFPKKAKAQKDLGDKGEKLVKQREIDFLIKNKHPIEASKVKIAKVGEGYDVLSFDELGNEKYIEVKTTTGNEYSPFNISENEIAFMQENPEQYCIYRVFNYEETNNSAEYFEIVGDVEAQLVMRPTNFKVFIKKED